MMERRAAAARAAVTRDELFELLWPGELVERGVLGARVLAVAGDDEVIVTTERLSCDACAPTSPPSSRCT